MEVEIELADLDDALRVVMRALEAAGAPEGSELMETSDGRVLREFGTLQCLAIFLDGSYRGFWQGPEETGMFFFGSEADAMFARVEPVLRGLPIGQNARVVLRHGKESIGPREIRMPRH